MTTFTFPRAAPTNLPENGNGAIEMLTSWHGPKKTEPSRLLERIWSKWSVTLSTVLIYLGTAAKPEKNDQSSLRSTVDSAGKTNRNSDHCQHLNYHHVRVAPWTEELVSEGCNCCICVSCARPSTTNVDLYTWTWVTTNCIQNFGHTL